MRNSHWSLVVVRISAVLAALVGIFQMFSGFGWAGPWAWHPRAGEAATLFTLIAAIFAFVWSRRAGSRGLFWLALGMTIFGLVQIAIGHMDMRLVHQILGIVYLLGVIALAGLAFRPARRVTRPEDATARH